MVPAPPARAAFRAALALVGRTSAARSPEQSRSAHRAAHERSSWRKGLLRRQTLSARLLERLLRRRVERAASEDHRLEEFRFGAVERAEY